MKYIYKGKSDDFEVGFIKGCYYDVEYLRHTDEFGKETGKVWVIATPLILGLYPHQDSINKDWFPLEGGEQDMKAKKKGMTKNQKLKMLKTSKAKKLVKSTKK